MTYNLSIPSDSLHTRFLTYRSYVSSTDLFPSVYKIFQINIFTETHFGSNGLLNQPALSSVRVRILDFAVEAARAQERRVDGVGAVCGHDDLDIHGLVEAVHLVQQLDQHALHLAVRGVGRVEPLGGDGVDLVDEDDAGRVFLGQPEHVAHHARPLAQLLLHELAAHHAYEGGRGLVGHGLGHHRLAGPRRAVHQHAARRVDADAVVLLRVRERQFDGLAHLLLLQVLPADVVLGHVRLLAHLHHLDGRVCLGRQDVHHGVGTLVQPDCGVRFEFLAVQDAQHACLLCLAVGRADQTQVFRYHLLELADAQRY